MTNTARKLAALALAAPALATITLSGTAAANAYEADADCVGLAVDMPRAEDGTTVTAYRNGIIERSVYVDTFGAPVRFTVPSPDQTVQQSWRVTVVGHNGAAPVFSEVVAPCVAPSTSSTTPATTTTAPAPTTSVAVSTPPVPSSTPPATPTTTVQPPRATTTTTVAARPTTFTLPETGSQRAAVIGAIALALVAVGAFLAQTARRSR